jgi:hypothetical protein
MTQAQKRATVSPIQQRAPLLDFPRVLMKASVQAFGPVAQSCA